MYQALRSLRSTSLRRTTAINTSINVPTRPFHSTAARMVVHEVTSKQQYDEVIKTHHKVVVDFHAVWCGPCKAISPILEKLSEDENLKDTIYFIKVDVDEVPDVAQEVGIRAMPTFISYKDGEKVDSLLGAVPPKLNSLVQSLAA